MSVAEGGMQEGSLEQRRATANALRTGEDVVGFMLASSLSMDFVQFVSPKPDFVIIEMEHSHFGLPDVATCLRMLNLVGIVSFVRIPEIRYGTVSSVLDAGADGVLVPRIRNGDELAVVVDSMRLPPIGGKGIGGYDFQGEDIGAKLGGYNTEKLLLIQVENQEAVANLEDMLSSGQVAGVIIGPYDLSHSLGIASEFAHPRFVETVARVVEICRRRHVSVGAFMPSQHLAAEWRKLGMSISWIGTEVSLFRAGWAQAHECFLRRT